MKIISIGSGLYACTRLPASLIEQYRAKQARCPHTKRDPQGTCYHCGHKKEAK